MGGRQHYALVANADFVMQEGAPGELLVEPEVLDFGEVPVGWGSTLSVLVSNTAAVGSASLVLSLTELAGDSEFVISGGSCTVDAVIEPQQDCTLELSFSPLSEGSFSGELTLETIDEQGQTVPLSGTSFQLPADIFQDRFEEDDEGESVD